MMIMMMMMMLMMALLPRLLVGAETRDYGAPSTLGVDGDCFSPLFDVAVFA